MTLLQNSAVHLEIVTDNVRIEVPKTSLETFNDNLYFRLVPIKERANQLDIKEQAKRKGLYSSWQEVRLLSCLVVQ